MALGEDGRPTAVPQLAPITSEEKRRCEAANTRRAIRLAAADELRRDRGQ
ncbi:MAG: hypothetical protein JO206_14805 [Solirubrobacterales bacterium]|nr:hypothetical protein [Solirubrobacterales bacterium]